MSSINLPLNPLIVRSFRARLRPAHMASWGLVTVTFCAFVFLIVYFTGIERITATREAAAKAALVPLIITQGFILMLLGTGSVASSLARERMAHLLDYQRLAPITPTRKIVGMLFGLPAREYFMFALTLPFVGYAVWASGFPLAKLAQFYIVFFISVWVYHMTGMVAGMAANKPWRATLQAQGLVVCLYLVLPSLSLVGFSFLEFLTVRPTFYALVAEEIRTESGPIGVARNWFQIERWQNFRFYEMSVHPTLVSIVVQLFALVSLFIVVHRKWREETLHPMSKGYAVLFFAGVQFFVLGSLWPHFTSDAMWQQLMTRLGLQLQPWAALTLSWVLFFVFLGIAMGLGGMLIYLVSPEAETTIKGWRRTRKRGGATLSSAGDAATGLPVTLLITLVTAAAFFVLVAVAERAERFGLWVPAWRHRAVAVGYVALILLFMQLAREQLSLRSALVGGFMLWVVPLFAFLILLAAQEAAVTGLYVGLACPVLGLYVVVSYMMGGGDPSMELEMVTEDIAPHLAPLTALSLGGYGIACVVLAGRWVRYRARLRRQAFRPA